MNYLIKTGLTGLGLLALAGCDTPAATGAARVTPAPQAQAPQNATGETRLVIYRTSYMGLAVQPKVFVDGQQAGTCAPGQATTVNVSPGTHRVSATTLAEKAVEVSVPKGSTAYVRCSISAGIVVGGAKLVVVPASEAAPKVAKLQASAAQ